MNKKRSLGILIGALLLALSLPFSGAAEPAAVEGRLVAKVDSGGVKNLDFGGIPEGFEGFIGTIVQVGEYPLTVKTLGRMFYEGNSGEHQLKLVDAATGEDVEGASVSVSGGTTGEFTYGSLAAPVTLQANATYYLLSKEKSGGDFYSDGCDVMYSDGFAVCGGYVREDGGAYKTFVFPNSGYLSLNMEFSFTPVEKASGTDTELFMDMKQTTLRNDYHSFIGMKIVTGASELVVTDLGRIFLEGNTQEHAVKIVDGETMLDVPGANVVVKGGTAGEFTYAKLAAPVTLKATHPYYLMSREYANGDNFCEGTASYLLTDDNDATLLGRAFFIISYNDDLDVNHGYVGINFRYQKVKTEPVTTAAAPAATSTTTAAGKTTTDIAGDGDVGGQFSFWIPITIGAVVLVAACAVTVILLIRNRKKQQ